MSWKQLSLFYLQKSAFECILVYKGGVILKHEVLSSAPSVLRGFLAYSETIRGKASTSVEEYLHDLTTLFRYIKCSRNLCSPDIPFEEIDISDITPEILKSITLYDLHAFLVFCKEERNNNARTRARKASTIRIYFKYLTNQEHLLEVNPAELLDTPKIAKTLPKHLTLEDSIDLLNAVDGENAERDYCILTIFLNCGLRLSELCGLNVTSIRDNQMKILGKGNKERIVYINAATRAAIDAYLPHRDIEGVPYSDRHALFISRNKRRISNKTVQHIVKKYLEKAGLDGLGLSTHKLRHTAATLMYQQGNVDIRTLQVILGHENLGTTQIYTHVSNEQVEKALDSNPLSNIKPKTKNT